MKRKILALFLSVGIVITGLPANALAAGVSQEVNEAVQEDYADLSHTVIQEGGFLPETEERASASSVESDKKEQVQDALKAAWDSFSSTCDLTAYQIQVEDFRGIYAETLNKNPKYFYVSGQCSYSYNSNGVLRVNIQYTKNASEAKSMRETYDREVVRAVSGAQASWSDMEKALYINDYLARNCEYDTSYVKYTAYDALVGRAAVCQGYALAFLDLAQELGLSCEMVTSESLNHAWNLVKLGGSYYNVDVTWNDPVYDRLGRACHAYFMKSTAFFKTGAGVETHLKVDDWVVSGGIQDTAASNTKYDNYFWNKADVGFDYIDGNWYGFNGNDSICKYSCDGTDFVLSESVKPITDTWTVIGSSGGYWQGKFVGVGSFNGKYYYSGRDSIYELNVATKQSVPVFTLSDAQKQSGYIYGMNISSSGELQYILAESPNASGEVLTAVRLEQPHVHTEEVRNALEATCQREGYTGDVYCSGCGVLIRKGTVVEKKAHTLVTDEAIPATCTEEGKTQGSHCSVCNEVIDKQEIIPPMGHEWDSEYTVDREPTTERDGEKSIHCIRCQERSKVQSVPKLEKKEVELSSCKITLATGRYIYNGNAKKPAVTVKNGDEILTLSKDYQVKYSNNIHAGMASVTIMGKGIYTGSVTKNFQIGKAANQIRATAKYNKVSKTSAQTFRLDARASGGSISYQSQNRDVKVAKDGKVTIAKNFAGKAVIKVTAGSGDYSTVTKNITITVNPAGVNLTRVKNVSGKKLALKWKKNSKASGYQIQYSTSKKFTGAKSKLVPGGSKTAKTLTKLNKKKTYYVRIRTYKTVAKVKYYSSWSSAKKCIIKK